MFSLYNLDTPNIYSVKAFFFFFFFAECFFFSLLQEFILSEDYNKMTPVKNYQGMNESSAFIVKL